MEEGRSALKILTDTPTRKKHLGRPRRRWEDYIRMDLRETDDNMRIWIDSAKDGDYSTALVNAVLNFRVPYSMGLVR